MHAVTISPLLGFTATKDGRSKKGPARYAGVNWTVGAWIISSDQAQVVPKLDTSIYPVCRHRGGELRELGALRGIDDPTETPEAGGY
jgi:hypothetical protein